MLVKARTLIVVVVKQLEEKYRWDNLLRLMLMGIKRAAVGLEESQIGRLINGVL